MLEITVQARCSTKRVASPRKPGRPFQGNGDISDKRWKVVRKLSTAELSEAGRLETFQYSTINYAVLGPHRPRE